MKRKLYLLTTMFCLMMLFGITAQAQNQRPQRACDVVKMEQTKSNVAVTPAKGVNNEKASEAPQLSKFHYYTPQQSPRLAESESTDSATVILYYDLEDYDIYNVTSIMVYNSQWSMQAIPEHINPVDGTPVKGIIVNVPKGTYDLYTRTFDNKGQSLIHIEELVNINNDTTILLNVSNAPNIFSRELYNNNGELLMLDKYRQLDSEPWQELIEEGNVLSGKGQLFIRLDNYGNVTTKDYTFGYNVEGRLPSYALSVNTLSDRYEFVVLEETIDKDGMFYVNRLTSRGTSAFPLKNKSSDYVAYKEIIQGSPKGIESVENPIVGLWNDTYLDNSKEYYGDINGNMPISEGRVAQAMINAPQNGDEQLQGVNIAVALGVVDLEQTGIQYGRPRLQRFYIVGPKLMVNEDKSMDCLVSSDVAKTQEVGIWKEDYPPHPRFSYNYEQKKGIVGNNCPLNIIDSRNAWNQWRNANMIVMSTQHWGRNGENIGSGNYNTTLIAKYNGEEIWNGKHALDSLPNAWCGTNPDGAYELEFTNANVAVDGITGKNVTTVYFDQRKEDQNPPVVSMLQFRDGENNVTDRFDTPECGVIMFAGGDFEPKTITYMTEYGYESSWNYKECQPMTVEVSYAPYGSNEWRPLEGVEHQEEYDDIPGMGFFYQGSLSSVNRESENGWFDLKFRLVDEAGNWQEQTLSPAFRIDNLVQSAVTEVRDSDAHEVARYSIDGKRVDTSHRGVTIIRMSDGTAHKVRQ